MKVAIHHVPGSFSERWIQYCKEHAISFTLVNAYDDDIIFQLKDCDIFMWHFSHQNYKDTLFAKQLLYSLQLSGKKVFPDFNTNWYFDDKLGQKYLLESIGAPMVRTYVFFTYKEAMAWISTTTFPKVFKLRGGAGSSNVMLISSRRKAKRIAYKAFHQGFSSFNKWNYFKEQCRKSRSGNSPVLNMSKAIVRLFYSPEYARFHGVEKGYVYFQDFVPNNQYDIRVIVVGDKAFAIKRMVRENDFRASGSGKIVYDKEELDEESVRISFEISRKLVAQNIALDFVFDGHQPLVVEIGYGYLMSGYDLCPGYWSSDLVWHEEIFNPQYWQIESLINSL